MGFRNRWSGWQVYESTEVYQSSEYEHEGKKHGKRFTFSSGFAPFSQGGCQLQTFRLSFMYAKKDGKVD